MSHLNYACSRQLLLKVGWLINTLWFGHKCIAWGLVRWICEITWSHDLADTAALHSVQLCRFPKIFTWLVTWKQNSQISFFISFMDLQPELRFGWTRLETLWRVGFESDLNKLTQMKIWNFTWTWLCKEFAQVKSGFTFCLQGLETLVETSLDKTWVKTGL